MWRAFGQDQKVGSLNIPNYTPKKADYVKERDVFHLCEIQGGRNEQQDAIATSYVESFPDFSIVDRISILRNTVKAMQDLYDVNSNAKPFGATLSTSIAWVDENSILHIWAANVGDSAVYVTIFDDEHKSSSTHRLTYLHVLNPADNPAEYDRVRAATNGTQPQQDRDGVYRLDSQGRQVMPSRSLGDNDVERYGLSHEPEIFEYRFQLTGAQRAKVTVACDGLEDDLFVVGINKCLYDSDIQNTNSAQALVAAAYNKGSTDNISVIVFTPGKTPASALVVDGHGGDKQENTALIFANMIANGFYGSLEWNISRRTPVVKKVEQDYIQKIERQYCAFFSQSTTVKEISNKIKKFQDSFKKPDNAICLEVAAGFYRGGAMPDLYAPIRSGMQLFIDDFETFKTNCMQELRAMIDESDGVIKTSKYIIKEMPFSKHHLTSNKKYIGELMAFSDLEKILPALPVQVCLSKKQLFY
ncbi:MAG: hypothetical protein V4496_05425 [Pseudomonadota bacterium]